MDSLGLLAAWVGVVSFLFTTVAISAAHLFGSGLQRWWATTSPDRARRRVEELHDGLDTAENPGHSDVADLVSLYGALLLNLVAAAGLVIVSILILDLGPALLASTLPFPVNTKLLTRCTGFFLLVATYYFVFRLASLAMRLRRKTVLRSASYSRGAVEEIADLCRRHGLSLEETVTTMTRK